jgi:hypothetical protein
MADSAYHATFSSPGANVFYHHMYQPYRYLLQKQYALKSLQAAKF